MPSRDPDDGEIDDVEEFLNTLDAVAHDEVLLSLLGEGRNLDVPGDVVDQQIANALSSWRGDVDREPMRDEAIGQKHPAGGEWPPATTGGTMSATDDAAALRSIQLPNGLIQQAMTEIDEAANQARAILGESGTGIGEINAAAAQTKEQLDAGYSHLQMMEQAIDNAAANLTRG
ncbi:hypothetical protein DMC63_01390 [Streptomyces sp. WAC 05977]|nr:hypothetical protein DMC63_01390 [Streptomyces sp. WAC 05977]